MTNDPAMDDCDCPPNPTPPEGALARDMPIVNRKGLHARATAKFVQCVEQFDSEITVSRCGETVGGTSITVSAAGADALAALDAIAALVANRFGEDE